MGNGLNPRRAVAFILALCLVVLAGSDWSLYAAGTAQRAPGAATQLVIVERDVPQTRNFDPVINHEALITNTSAKTLSVDIVSPITKGLNTKGRFFPAFGQDSLLGEPMQSPYQIGASKYDVLGRPVLAEENGQQCYIWRRVAIKPGSAVIAQYDNYYGKRSQFTTRQGVRLCDLDVRTDYKATVSGKNVVLTLSYRLKNLGTHPWRGIFFGAFLPDTVAGEKVDLVNMEISKTSASAGAHVERSAISDGRERMTHGSDLTFMLDALLPGQEASCWLVVSGVMKNPGGIYPLLTIQARSEGDRIWPKTIVRSTGKIKTEGFYYRHLSMVMPDPKYFVISKDWRITTAIEP